MLPRYFDARPMVTLSSEGLRQVEEMRSIGWKQNAYAVDDYVASSSRYFDSHRPHLANFAAVRKSWTSSEGHTICWYDWEFKGVSF